MNIRHLSLLAVGLLAVTGCTTSSNTNPGPSSANNRDVNRNTTTTARETGAISGQTVNAATNRTN